MTIYHVTYRKLNKEDWDGPEFEIIEPPGPNDLVIREQTIPGQFGRPDLFIQRETRYVGRDKIHLVTYGYKRLKPHELRSIVNQALKFAREQENDHQK